MIQTNIRKSIHLKYSIMFIIFFKFILMNLLNVIIKYIVNHYKKYLLNCVWIKFPCVYYICIFSYFMQIPHIRHSIQRFMFMFLFEAIRNKIIASSMFYPQIKNCSMMKIFNNSKTWAGKPLYFNKGAVVGGFFRFLATAFGSLWLRIRIAQFWHTSFVPPE